jgi:hypothetical protein
MHAAAAISRIRLAPLALATVALACASCQSESISPRRPSNAGWQQVGTWKGRGNAQLDTFQMDHYGWRIAWETKNAPGPGRGRLYVQAHSGDSGRLLAEPIDVTGNGHDTAYVNVDPHRFYLVVESSDVDWSLTVEEPAGAP